MKKFICLGGLPRSGSTLLVNILEQNPAIEITPTSFLPELVLSSRTAYTNSEVRKAWLDQSLAKEKFLNFTREGVKGFFNESKIGLDKSRAWISHIDFLSKIFSEKEIFYVVPVRDLRDILASMERRHRESPEIAVFSNRSTQESRVNFWLESNPLGPCINSVREIFVRNWMSKVLFVRFEDLVVNPEGVTDSIYSYIGEDRYSHDFNEISTATKEHDAIHGPVGNHTLVSKKVTVPATDWKSIINPDLSSGVVRKYEWFYQNLKYEG
jgi:hypothetical protein